MDMKADNLLILSEYRDRITQNKVVRLRFRVKEQGSGELLQYGDDLVYLHGGYGGAFPKVEQAIEGCQVGDRVDLTLSPGEGYGERDPARVLVLPTEDFQDGVPETGTAVEGELPNGESMIFTVSDTSTERVILDGNHPFAGKELVFDFEVLDVRDASDDECAAGFAFDGMFC